MSQGKRFEHGEAMEVAIEIVTKLRPYCEGEQIEIAGSLRRYRPTVGDIEIVAVPKVPRDLFGKRIKKVPDYLTAHLRDRQVPMTLDGDKLKRFRYRGIPVDLFLVDPEEIGRFGWRMILSTGSGQFNKWLVTQKAHGGAMPENMKSDDGWLWAREPGHWFERLHTPDEPSVFFMLGLPFIPAGHRDEKKWYKIVREAQEAREGVVT